MKCFQNKYQLEKISQNLCLMVLILLYSYLENILDFYIFFISKILCKKNLITFKKSVSSDGDKHFLCSILQDKMNYIFSVNCSSLS